MVYFISDTHFYHKSIIPYCRRPFSSLEEMNKRLIQNWNNKVENNDTVYFLGDFSFANVDKTKDICNQLNGYKIIIKGNHDRDKGEISWKNIGFNEVINTPQKFYYVDKNSIFRYIIISHEPQNIKDNEFNIHGHIHDSMLGEEYPDMNPNNHLCVSVERINYTPISFEEIQKEYLEKFFNKKEGRL